MTIDTEQTKVLWERIAEQLASHKDPYASLNAIYEIQLTDVENGLYQLEFADGVATIHYSEIKKPNCTLRMRVKNFEKLLYGNLNTTAAFMTGQLKVEGNIALALKLENVLKKYNFNE